MKKKILAVVLGALGLSVVTVLVLAARKPDSFRVERSLSMHAPPERVFTELDDFHNWSHWSPWEKLEPDMKRTYSGAASGQGAVYAWEGKKEAGAGRMEITGVKPAHELSLRLDFTAPFPASNVVTFTLEPSGDDTKVTWAMTGPSPFVSKVMQVFVDMDKLVGKDFERGLAQMKATVEGAPSAPTKQPLSSIGRPSAQKTRPEAPLRAPSLVCFVQPLHQRATPPSGRSLAAASSQRQGNDRRTESTLSFTPVPPGYAMLQKFVPAEVSVIVLPVQSGPLKSSILTLPIVSVA